MPELPEVENVRQTLLQLIQGQQIRKVTIHRPDIITGIATPQSLLLGKTIANVHRHGKQLAILANDSTQSTLNIHLGMTGRLMGLTGLRPKHCHIEWGLANGDRLGFIDPRRFGGLWTFSGYQDLLQSRWSKLGDDALLITSTALSKRLARTTRSLKAALLDQNLVAGLGNIYVDELCFNCKIRPDRIACEVAEIKTFQKLVREMRKLLKQAIKQGGSTLRDYVMVNGHSGQFQNLHKVYGRTGKPCVTCSSPLQGILLAGRTTVFCPSCQQ
ncbi:MAG: bifunctional DNA-formamidopyrimidine glycosylase/DNA-(apurinic or apyrimidinic site) lyase [Phycisphaeraceae bacterium]|nr:bifunctional DNA-formamidopyrimidine glycosylase/DNA-(apurinic or apyrimidinic site) lyase [Phycisphaeraceae bacterium]